MNMRIIVRLLFSLIDPAVLVFISGIILFFTRKTKFAKYFILLILFIILLVSCKYTVSFLAYFLEKKYPEYTFSKESSVDYIVVLGGKKESFCVRLIEGIRIRNLYPDMKMIIFAPLKMKKMIYGLADSKKGLIITDKALNTEAEVAITASIVKAKPFLLVTSAYHMKRAMMIYEKNNLNPIPVKTDLLKTGNGEAGLFSFNNVCRFQVIIHEYIGIIWFKIKSIIC